MKTLLFEIKKHHFIKLHEQKHLFSDNEIKRKKQHKQPITFKNDLVDFYKARAKGFIPKKRC